MNMKRNNWKLGEVVELPKTGSQIHKSGKESYEHMTSSCYVCVREAANGQRGILVKMMGRIKAQEMMIVNHEPFCKDETEETEGQTVYYSYRFPTSEELKEVLDIVRSNDVLWRQLDEASMFINPDGSFWVREMERKFLVVKHTQYYDPKTGFLSSPATADEAHRRLTIAYF
jgi:hypothetical protein